MEMTEKKTYETPEAEKMMFNYRDQVVVASGCDSFYSQTGPQNTSCKNPQQDYRS